MASSKMCPDCLVPPSGTTEPTGCDIGSLFYNTDEGVLKVNSSEGWVEVYEAPPPTVSVTSGLVFSVESWNPDSWSSTSDGTLTDTAGGRTGYATNQRSDSPTNNVSPEAYTDGANVGAVWNFNGGNTPNWWWSFPAVDDLPKNSAARTYSVWFKADSVNVNALGGQDGTPTWTNGGSLSTGSAYILCERGNGWEITGHSYDQHSSPGESVTNTWINITVADNGSSFIMYRNGVQIGSDASNGFNSASTNFFIGRHWSKEDLAGINGKISCWYIWNRQLSSSEVTTIYNDLKGWHGV